MIQKKKSEIIPFVPSTSLILCSNANISGDLLSEDEVLEWLRKNRFRQPELNIFMYALIAISIAFVLYTGK